MATQDMPTDPRDKSLGDLFADLTRDTATLVRQELDLARVEMTQKAVKAGKDIAMIAVGGLVAYTGTIVLLVGVAFLLARLMPEWVAFLIAGVLIAGIGGAVAMSGLAALKKVDPMPRQTIETLKEDAQALKGH